MNFFPKEKKIYREGIIFSDLQSNQNLKQIVSSHELIHIDQRLLSTFHKKKNNPTLKDVQIPDNWIKDTF